MSTEMIVRNCAPTLAGLKVGSLFSYACRDEAEALRHVEERNRLLNAKGVYFVLVRVKQGMAMIYVYRKKRLERALADPAIQKFLQCFGYNEFEIDACLEELKKRLLMADFPHEIGVFLGYPLADIQAFIENKGANCPCTGCWKAYTDLERAEATFQLFHKCTRLYCQRFDEGFDITRLTVAG